MNPALPDVATPAALLIFPCNGNGIEALDCLGKRYRCSGFVDDDKAKQHSPQPHGYPVSGREALYRDSSQSILVVPGGPHSFRQRARVIAELDIDPARFATVIHPCACVSPMASIGMNVLLMAGVVVTSDAVIGPHVVVLPNTVVHHGAQIEACALIGANVTLAGEVRIGANCYIGSGSSVMNGVHIGAGAMVGLGSTVIRDVAPGAVVAGNPVRRLR